MTEPVFSVRDLRVSVRTRRGLASIVNGVDLTVDPGRTLAIVGESGSGKSMTMLAATGLTPPGVDVDGSVRLLGTDLRTMRDRQLRAFRGRHAGFVFQDPLSSLNPLMTVGRQIGEAYQLLQGRSRADARRRSIELLDQVGILEPEQRVDSYPHHFSGGMQQRVMIAMALACEPELIIADEATTALDVTIQAQVIDLVTQLQAKLGTSVIWITHDLSVVAGLADTVAVMYGGRIVEQAPVDDLFERPVHPYTRALLAARPRIGDRSPLAAIPGSPPSPLQPPPGCAFYPRCSVRADARCAT
ncbi:MAG TPA: ABC transporter ATP-binding protein, partial [Trebonia sp.]|nr:ABC transporter ATP-binding protein [Trebonia sp.]